MIRSSLHLETWQERRQSVCQAPQAHTIWLCLEPCSNSSSISTCLPTARKPCALLLPSHRTSAWLRSSHGSHTSTTGPRLLSIVGALWPPAVAKSRPVLPSRPSFSDAVRSRALAPRSGNAASRSSWAYGGALCSAVLPALQGKQSDGLGWRDEPYADCFGQLLVVAKNRRTITRVFQVAPPSWFAYPGCTP
jgi:hypothetical protein